MRGDEEIDVGGTASQSLDDRASSKWLEIASKIDDILKQVSTKDALAVEAGSSLSGDDKACAPYQLSHVVSSCITSGVDHLHAAKSLVVDLRVLHMAAPQTLARAALESFSTAYWCLAPTNRTERVTRTLRWHAQDRRDADKAIRGLGLPDNEPLDRKLEKLYAVGERRGISERAIKERLTITEALSYTDSQSGDGAFEVTLPWRVCSGLAHSRLWTLLGSLEHDSAPSGASDDVLDVRVTNSLPLAIHPSLVAFDLLNRLLTLRQERATSHVTS